MLLGRASGYTVLSMVAIDHPHLVRAVILAASQATRVSDDIAEVPFIACDPTRSEYERLAVPQRTFFPPGHDARAWLGG